MYTPRGRHLLTPRGTHWYTPREEDGCYIEASEGVLNEDEDWTEQTVCWWHMADGAVLGVHDGMVIEYDPTTLAPLGRPAGQKGPPSPRRLIGPFCAAQGAASTARRLAMGFAARLGPPQR